jgi:hypothetical protein
MRANQTIGFLAMLYNRGALHQHSYSAITTTPNQSWHLEAKECKDEPPINLFDASGV